MSLVEQFKSKSVAEIDREIAKVNGDLEALREQQRSIEGQMADNWNGDNSSLEAEYARIAARLKSGDIAIERLKEAREASFRRENFGEYEKVLKRREKTVAKLNDLDDKIIEAAAQLGAMCATYAQLEKEDDQLQIQLNSLAAELNRQGVRQQVYDAIYAKYDLNPSVASRQVRQYIGYII